MRTLYHKKGQERGFFQTYNYDSDKLNVYGQTKHIIWSFLYNIRNYMYKNSENLLKTVHFTENIYRFSCTFIRCHWAFWSSILVFEWTGCFGASNRLSFPVARNFCSVFILVKHQPIDNFMLNFSSNYIYKYSWRRQYDWQG